MARLLPILFLIMGLAGGGGAAWLLQPASDKSEIEEQTSDREPDTDNKAPTDHEFVKLNNQFVVPVVSGERVAALVVLSLSLETRPGMREKVYSHEPKLRDLFLQVLFDHANMGGFHGSFTHSGNLDVLRRTLGDVARAQLGPDVINVLIIDIVRQDV